MKRGSDVCLSLASRNRSRRSHPPGHRSGASSRVNELIGEERCQIVVPPAVPAGMISLTIRKPSTLTMTLDAFEQANLFDEVHVATDGLSA